MAMGGCCTRLTQAQPQWPCRALTSGVRLTLVLFMPFFLVARSQPAGGDLVVRQDEQRLLRAGLPTHTAGLLQFFRERTLSQGELDRLEQQVRQLGAVAYQARQQALAQLVRAGHRARRRLREALTDPDPEIARRAALALQRARPNPENPIIAAAARVVG
jgi:hypothetical protein